MRESALETSSNGDAVSLSFSFEIGDSSSTEAVGSSCKSSTLLSCSSTGSFSSGTDSDCRFFLPSFCDSDGRFDFLPPSLLLLLLESDWRFLRPNGLRSRGRGLKFREPFERRSEVRRLLLFEGGFEVESLPLRLRVSNVASSRIVFALLPNERPTVPVIGVCADSSGELRPLELALPSDALRFDRPPDAELRTLDICDEKAAANAATALRLALRLKLFDDDGVGAA